MDKDIPLGMKFGRLIASLEILHLRQDLLEKAALIEKVKALQSVRGEEDLHEFLTNPLGAHHVDLRCMSLDRLPCGGINREVKRGGEADGPEHAELIFLEAP